LDHHARWSKQAVLLKQLPMRDKHKLQKQTHNYRRDYGKPGFTFEVRMLPRSVDQAARIRESYGEDAVGLWTLWTPIGNGQADDLHERG